MICTRPDAVINYIYNIYKNPETKITNDYFVIPGDDPCPCFSMNPEEGHWAEHPWCFQSSVSGVCLFHSFSAKCEA